MVDDAKHIRSTYTESLCAAASARILRWLWPLNTLKMGCANFRVSFELLLPNVDISIVSVTH